ncbi:MAG: sensor histidine kinase [Syntrophomonadaceae bacterium]
MKGDESNKLNKDKGPQKQGAVEIDRLDNTLQQVVDTLEQGRLEIFDIAQDCDQQCSLLEVELEELKLATIQVIEQVEKTERLEKQARFKLMEVSSQFNKMSEEDIKAAYDEARSIQVQLMELRQREIYLRKHRDDVAASLKNFRSVSKRASNLLMNTSLALNVLQGNVSRITDTIEDIQRKQQMELWIIESQEAERRKISREIHDGPAQSLASMIIRLDLLGRDIPGQKMSLAEQIADLKKIAAESLTDIRRIMFDLKPALFHDKGLSSALRDYFNDYEAKYNFDIDLIVLGEERQYDLSLEIALFRLVQEAITNVRKHAGVNKAMVKMEDTGEGLTIVVKDNGAGFDTGKISDQAEHYGIMGMRERVQLIGGRIEIISAPNSGTQVIIFIPLEGDGHHEQNKGNNRR